MAGGYKIDLLKRRMGASEQPPSLPSSKNYTILDYGYCKVWKRWDTQREAMEEYEVLI